ncbi:MAG: hypothetical protein KIPDCIKN_04376 [Haliscomenobacter sp.]|nr:hypothetical protein [Haliscomenobacter sp.]
MGKFKERVSVGLAVDLGRLLLLVIATLEVVNGYYADPPTCDVMSDEYRASTDGASEFDNYPAIRNTVE